MEIYLNELEKIAYDEIENAKRTIPLVQKNSRLGWEPSMEYLGDERHILWKLKQMDYMLEHEIGLYKSALRMICKWI